MKPKIDLVTIVTANVPKLTKFYHEGMGFPIKSEADEYVEFDMDGVRLAVCSVETMENATKDPGYGEETRGHSFELAFPVDSPEDVDRVFAHLVARGARPVKEPADMPWGQRAGFFADPDGNIHEVFATLHQE